MQLSLTAHDIYAHILLLRTVDTRAILLLEGETDCAIVDSHIDVASCDSMPTFSKNNAVEAAHLAEQNGLGDVIAIVDRDWIGILDPSPAHSNVFYTGLYDLETTFFSFQKLRTRILNSHARRSALRLLANESDPAHPVTIAIKAARALASFRYASRVHRWGVGVRDFPIHTIIDTSSGDPDFNLLCVIAKARAKVAFDEKLAVIVVRQIYDSSVVRFDDCSGHDLMNALSYVLNRRFGTSISGDVLAASFRAAVGCLELAQTKFFGEVDVFVRSRGFEVWSCPC